MPFVPVPNTCLIEIQMLLDGQQVENTLYASKVTPYEVADLEELAQLVVVWWQEECIPLYSNQVFLQAVVCTSLEDAEAAQWVEPVNTLNVGALTSPALPNNNAFTITILTSARGRSNRGRNYITGLTEAVVTNNQINGQHISDWLAAYSELKARIDLIARFLVVVSKYSGVDGSGNPIPREEGVATIVTGFRVFDDVIDSQRRRLPGRGS